MKFLKFVKADLRESESDFEDDFVKRLQETIHRIKRSREMEERFMIFEEMLRDERAEGRTEGIVLGKAQGDLELLEEQGEIPESIRDRIMNETDLETLSRWHKLAAKAESMKAFLDKM